MMMMDGGRGLIKALENWAKRVTTGYKDVHVRDLSSSFRDGLAFCAIIHHYRPDLIDFESLSKENIFENNSLAFKIAEKQLGVPALLDAEDMVTYARPDRLSIITYLSQLRNCFENQNKVSTKKPDLKRIQKNTSGPPSKVSMVEPSLVSSKRIEVCQICKNQVFILERLIVDGKLYHTVCFRCHKCNCLLNPGAYIDSDTAGLYECTVCPADEKSESAESSIETSEQLPLDEKTESAESSMEISEQLPLDDSRKLKEENISLPKFNSVHEREFSNKHAIDFAKSNLLQNSKPSEELPNSLKNSTILSELDFKSSVSSISVKDKISAFEKNQESSSRSNSLSSPSIKSAECLTSSKTPSLPNNVLSSGSSLFTPKSPVKSRSEPNQFSSAAKYSSIKQHVTDERNSSFGSANDTEKTMGEKKLDVINLNVSTSNIIINHIETDSPDNIKNSIPSVSESPRSPRDIFKRSMQPLKLNLSSNKIDYPVLQRTYTNPEKTFSIPQIKSSYSTLSQQKIDTKLKRFNSDIKMSSSETVLNKDDQQRNDNKTIRRSSFESNQNNIDKISPNTSIVNSKINRTNSAHEMSSNYQSDSLSCEKDYIPVYTTSSSIETSTLSNSSVSQSVERKSSTSVSPGNEEKQNIDPQNNKISRSESEPKSLTDDTFSSNLDSHIKSPDTPIPTLKIEVLEEEYPSDLNPFGDDEEPEQEYPNELNPFGDDDEEESLSTNKPVDDYDDSKNPFADDDDDDQTEIATDETYSQTVTVFENRTPTIHNSLSSNISSPPDSLKGTLKKRQAPRPPKLSDIFPKESADSGLDTSFNSAKSSPSISKKSFQTSSPKIRKNKPAPPPPQASHEDSAADMKMTKESNNMKLKHKSVEQQEPPKQYKKKKRPAPPVPIPMRKDAKKIPLKEIIREMKEIEDKQREYERQGREIELLIRDRDKDEEPSVEEEEYIMQLFELVNQKNALFRRQAELMYIKRSQRLEEQQQDIEKQIRLLMEKPENEKTEEDRTKEEELTMELIDIVDQRNSIIDSIEMDRRRELEEDFSVQEQLEIKNGELPITAEIKQKSKGKKSKSKEKKEKKKKKKEEDQESGKGTLKRKHFFKRP